MPGPYETVARIAQIEDGLPKESYYGKRQDALALKARYGNGRISPLVRLGYRCGTLTEGDG